MFGGSSRALPLGQAVQLHDGGTGIVGACLGRGGQGAVYACDVGGRQLALKWYWPEAIAGDPTLAGRIARLVAEGPPDPRFAWPLDLATIAGRASFGYVMPLISPDRVPLVRLLQPPAGEPATALAVRAMTCFTIADSFQALHARGLCYQDINLGAFFVDPLRGDVVICDPDNVTPDGEPAGVYGTPLFEPPEVVLREAMPSGRTDLFAMAVLFFLVLVGCHPLAGRRTAADDRQAFGTDPLFVFDPADAANRPADDVQAWLTARWRALTGAMRDLFVRSFTAGLRDPGRRVLEPEWRVALAGLRDVILACPACALEIALDVQAAEARAACPACTAAILRPARLSRRHVLAGLRPADKLYRHQVDDAAPPSFAVPVGAVATHPANPALIGLHNQSNRAWTARPSGGETFAVAPGQTVRIADGVTLDFGTGAGVMMAADQPFST